MTEEEPNKKDTKDTVQSILMIFMTSNTMVNSCL